MSDLLYVVVEADSSGDLARGVSQMIVRGWMCAGGVAMVHYGAPAAGVPPFAGSGWAWAQAMVRNAPAQAREA